MESLLNMLGQRFGVHVITSEVKDRARTIFTLYKHGSEPTDSKTNSLLVRSAIDMAENNPRRNYLPLIITIVTLAAFFVGTISLIIVVGGAFRSFTAWW